MDGQTLPLDEVMDRLTTQRGCPANGQGHSDGQLIPLIPKEAS
jgi:hypothetical protein